MSEERRVVLVKPGDVLLIGNAAGVDGDPEAALHASEFFDELGIRVALFASDIDLDVLNHPENVHVNTGR